MSLYDVQVENSVLSAVLCGATRAEVADANAEDFTDFRVHVWQAIETLFQQGAAVDEIVICDLLKTRGRLAEVGGPAGIMSLNVGGNFARASLPYHVAILKDRGRRRRLSALAKRLEGMALDTNLKPEAIAADVAQSAMAATASADGDEPGDVDFWEIHDRWGWYANATEEERRQRSPYLPMPWEEMRTNGWYGYPESLSVVAGRSGIGKTGMLSTCMAYWLRVLPHKGAVIGLEDGTSWLDERWLAQHLGIDYANVANMRLNDYQMERYQDFAERIVPLMQSKLKKYRRAGLTAGQLLMKCRRWVDEGVKWIVVDHGLRVNYEADARGRDDKVIGATMDALANLALNSKVHIIVAWHLNRASEDDSQPSLRDLKESGYLDAAARAIYGLWRKDGRTLCTVVKATKVAPVGATAELFWDTTARTGMLNAKEARLVDFMQEQRDAKAAAEEDKRMRKSKAALFGT